MHFHLPKPLHGWREFLGEVGIIVIGVLVALSFEQVVERMHWRHAVSEAETSMRTELTEDNGPQGFERLAFAPCIDAQLKLMQDALVAERDAGTPFEAAPLSIPHFFTWDSNAYQQATASGALNHVTTARAYAWSGPYALSDGINALQVKEQADYGDLRMIEAAPQHPSDFMRTQLFETIAKARADNAVITQLVTSYFRYVRLLDISFSKEEQRRYVQRDSYLSPECAARSLGRR